MKTTTSTTVKKKNESVNEGKESEESGAKTSQTHERRKD